MSHKSFYKIFFLFFLSFASACHSPIVASDDEQNEESGSEIDDNLAIIDVKLIDRVYTIYAQEKNTVGGNVDAKETFKKIVKSDGLIKVLEEGQVVIYKLKGQDNNGVLGNEGTQKTALEYILKYSEVSDDGTFKSRVLMTKNQQATLKQVYRDRVNDVVQKINQNNDISDDDNKRQAIRQAITFVQDQVINDGKDVFLNGFKFFDDDKDTIGQWVNTIIVGNDINNEDQDHNIQGAEAFGLNGNAGAYNTLKGHLEQIRDAFGANQDKDTDAKKVVIELFNEFTDALKRYHELNQEMEELSDESCQFLIQTFKNSRSNELAKALDESKDKDDNPNGYGNIIRQRIDGHREKTILEEAYAQIPANLGLEVLMKLLYQGQCIISGEPYYLTPYKPHLFAKQLANLKNLIKNALANPNQDTATWIDCVAPYFMPPVCGDWFRKKLGVSRKRIRMHYMIKNWEVQIEYMEVYAEAYGKYEDVKLAKIQAGVDLLKSVDEKQPIVMTSILEKVEEDKGLKSLMPKPYKTPYTLDSIKHQRGAQITGYIVWSLTGFWVVKRVYSYTQSNEKDYKKEKGIDEDDDDDDDEDE